MKSGKFDVISDNSCGVLFHRKSTKKQRSPRTGISTSFFSVLLLPKFVEIMSDRTKKIFLAICIILPFVLYCFYYYSQMFKNAPFRFADFESIVLKYGEGDNLVNQFDSKTGRYQFLNTQDSMVVDT